MAGSSRQRYADVGLSVLLLVIIALMIVPVPTPLLDVLIASNIAIAVLMLLIAMAIPDGLAFTAMPTVLLVTTLYRLALNVSSTRLILLQADAGRVIRAFGEYVVAGNYAVGAVVFAILTLIQYVVVARGSERVAEVGARFTLDAMPGKQMAIDADLRSGALTVEAARERRRWLEREGQFYGAMDGAMKFVKGDAIAGIVIALVNIVAGVAIGVSMRKLGVRESLQTYGLLTIGDGLVCQIPSLLISTSAGLVVTRVASKDERASLAGELSAQLFGNPRVLLMSGGFLLFLALVPGLPALPFGLLALLLAVSGLGLRRAQRAAAGRVGSDQPLAVPPIAPIALELGGELEPDARTELEAALEDVCERMRLELGVPLQQIAVERRPELPPRGYRVALWNAAVAQGELAPELAPHACARELASALDRVASGHAAELLGLQETQGLLDALARRAPALVHALVPRPISLKLLRDVLRRLLAERISIRALEPILEALASEAPGGADPELLAERVRAQLCRQITAAHARDGVIAVHPLDPMIEDALREALPDRGASRGLALPPDQARDIVDAVRAALALDAAPAVLLTQADVRPHLRGLLQVELPEVVVLSFAELVPEVRVERRPAIRLGRVPAARSAARVD